MARWAASFGPNSFASNGECGLKQLRGTFEHGALVLNSFASNGECGLKPSAPAGTENRHSAIHSPAMANVD